MRAGETLGSPIAMLIPNRDWKNWQEIMDPAPSASESAVPSAVVVVPSPERALVKPTLRKPLASIRLARPSKTRVS